LWQWDVANVLAFMPGAEQHKFCRGLHWHPV
jgi:hypothetical protein